MDLREWAPDDDLAHFVLEAAGRVPMDRFRVNARGSGSAQYHPQMMLALLIYCYAQGIFGSRRIERATYRDLGVRYITADRHPDYDTICKFRREQLKEQLDAACERLERQAQARADHEWAAYERKVAAREARAGRRKGKAIQPPKATPAGKEQTNLTDPDSALMRKNKRSEYRQSYNAQCVVDAQGSQLIVASRVSRCASDRNELVADIQAIPEELGRPETVVADNGYASQTQVEALEQPDAAGQRMEVLASVGVEGRRRRYTRLPPRGQSPTDC